MDDQDDDIGGRRNRKVDIHQLFVMSAFLLTRFHFALHLCFSQWDVVWLDRLQGIGLIPPVQEESILGPKFLLEPVVRSSSMHIAHQMQVSEKRDRRRRLAQDSFHEPRCERKNPILFIVRRIY